MKKILSIFILVMAVSNAAASPVYITNVEVEPNPFSPNGDGRADTTTFSFILSGYVDTVYLRIFRDSLNTSTGLRDTVIDSIVAVLTPGIQGANVMAWTNVETDPSILPDGPYHYFIYGSDTTDTATGIVYIDRQPPTIYNVSVTPNPFSPNGDGINDYAHIAFSVTGSYRPEDSLFFRKPPLGIGYLQLWYQNGAGHGVFVANAKVDSADGHVDNIIEFPYPVYLALAVGGLQGLEQVDLRFFDYANRAIDITAQPNEDIRIGIPETYLLNKFMYFSSSSFIVTNMDSLDPGVSILIPVYAFTGNASITITDINNQVVSVVDFVDVYRGDGNYFTDWGPDNIPDGLYTFSIQAQDESYNVELYTGNVIANSIPTNVDSLTVSPSVISPANLDGRADAALVQFSISEEAHVTVRVYNSATQWDTTTLVRTLIGDSVMQGGSHSLTFDGRDNNGNFLAQNSDSTYTVVVTAYDPYTLDSDVKSAPIVVDNLSPSFDTLYINTLVNNTIDTLYGKVNEPGSEIRVFRNGYPIGIAIADSITGNFSLVVTYVEGINTFTAIAYDAAYNSDTASVTALCDLHAPTLASSSPFDGEAFQTFTIANGKAVLIDSIYHDSASGIDWATASVHLYYENYLRDTYLGSPITHLGDTLFIPFITDSINAHSGHYRLIVSVQDRAGNTMFDTVRFTVDRVAPTIVTIPDSGSPTNMLDTVMAVIRDSISGVDTISTTVSLEKRNVRTIEGTTFWRGDTVFFVPLSPIPRDGSDDGEYIFAVDAVDKAGNYTPKRSLIIYDTRPPHITTFWPPDSSTFQDSVTGIDTIFAVVNDSFGSFAGSGLDVNFSLIRLVNTNNGQGVIGNQIYHGDTLKWAIDPTLYDPAYGFNEEGTYMITVTATDSAGNSADTSSTFIIDLSSPIVTEVYPADSAYVNASPENIHAIVVERGSGINKSASYIHIYRPDGGEVPGTYTFVGDTLLFSLENPFPEDGTWDGQFTIVVHVEDNVGKTVEDTFHFIYDTQPPQVVWSTPSDSSYLNRNFETDYNRTIKVRLSDATSGLDFGTSGLSILVNWENYNASPSNYLRLPPDTLGFHFDSLIEGEIEVVVWGYDHANNLLNDTLILIVDTTKPSVVFVPDSGTMTNSLSTFSAYIRDLFAGPDTASTHLAVYRLDSPSDTTSIGLDHYEWLGDTIVFYPYPPIATDGSNDGEYLIRAYAYDKSGNVDSSRISTIFYDSKPPYVVSHSQSSGADTLITDTLSEIWVLPSDANGLRWVSGIDTNGTQVSVVNQFGAAIAGHREWRGDTLFFVFDNPISADGRYTARVYMADLVGNTSTDSFRFVVDLNSPQITWSDPADSSYVNSPPNEIRIFIQDLGSGVNFNACSVVVYTPNMGTVLGHTEVRNDTIVFVLEETLPTDGSADGVYTVLVWGQDNNNRPLSPSNPDTLMFTFDTQVPQLVSYYPTRDTALNQFNSPEFGPDTIFARLRDATAGVDLTTSDLTLLKYGLPISGVAVTRRSADTTLIMALPSGLEEGRYSFVVKEVDFAHNLKRDSINFVYDLTGPVISALMPDSEKLNMIDSIDISVIDTLAGTDTMQTNLTVRLLDAGRTIGGDIVWLDPSTVRFVPDPPLATDGSDDGLVEVETHGFDMAGNGSVDTSYLIYDTRPPRIVDDRIDFFRDTLTHTPVGSLVMPTDTVIEDSFFGLRVALDDSYFGRTVSGIDPVRSTASLTYQGGAAIPGITMVSNDTLYLTLSDTIREDDRFTARFNIADEAGNSSEYEHNFIVDLYPPVLAGTVPPDGGFINSPPTYVAASIFDNGSGVLMDTSVTKITLIAPDNHIVLGYNEFVNDTLYFRIQENIDSTGIADGTYTMIVRSMDNSGKGFVDTLSFVLDTQLPSLDSSLAVVNGNEYPLEDGYFNQAPDTLWFYLSDRTSGANLLSSGVSLHRYGQLLETSIVRDTVNDRLGIVPLSPLDDGRYFARVSVVDRALNFLVDTVSFVIDRVAPSIDVQPENGVAVNRLDTITVYLNDTLAGIDTITTTVSLTGPNGDVPLNVNWIDGVQAICTPVQPLATNGSDDADDYVIYVEAYDKANNVSVSSVHITYDTRPPYVTERFPDSLSLGDVNSVWVRFADSLSSSVHGSGVDSVLSIIRLTRAETGEAIPGQKIVRGDTLIFNIDAAYAPLADGRYKFYSILYDKAGNMDSLEYEFVVDTRGPSLVWSMPRDSGFINYQPQAIYALIADEGTGLNYDTALTNIRVQGPDGRYLIGYNEFIGDTLVFHITDSSLIDGYYNVEVRAHDMIGRPLNYAPSGSYDSVQVLTFAIDRRPPTLAWSYPAHDTAIQRPEGPYVVEFNDLLAGINLSSSGADLMHYGVPVEINITRVDSGDVVIGNDTVHVTNALVIQPVDSGSFDVEGRYKLAVIGVDKALNVVQDTIQFIVDRQPPELTFYPADSSYLDSIDRIYVIVSDTLAGANNSSIDFALVGPNGDMSGTLSWYGDTAEFVPTNPFQPGGYYDGKYNIIVSAYDRAMNMAYGRSDFIYDTRPPYPTMFYPSQDSVVPRPVYYAWMRLTDVYDTMREVSGVDIGACQIGVLDPDGVTVPGNMVFEGDTAIRWSFRNAIIRDGRYTVWAKYYDRAGNFDSTSYEFTLDLNPPVVVWSSPEDSSYINHSIQDVQVVLDDRGGSGVNPDSSRLYLVGPNGDTLLGSFSISNDTLNYHLVSPLPADGSADGVYRMLVHGRDYVNDPAVIGDHTIDDTLMFVYDTRAPYLVASYPIDNAMLNTAPETLWVQLGDQLSGVSLGTSNLTLFVNGLIVPGTVYRDVVHSRLMFVPDNPLTDNEYSLLVFARDTATNEFVDTVNFIVDTQEPDVVITPNDGATVNQLTEITMSVEDNMSGVDTTLSYINVTGPNGVVAAQRYWTGDTLHFVPTPPLRTDGSDDGRYTAAGVGYDMAGNIDVNTISFIYDTRPPFVQEFYPQDIQIMPLRAVWAVVSDTLPGRAVSGVNFSASRIRLYTESGAIIPGSQVYRGDTLIWQLTDSLVTEGRYRIWVYLEDNAGNVDSAEHYFTIDLANPVVQVTYPDSAGYVKDTLASVWAAFGNAFSGMNWDSSVTRIEVLNPMGDQLPGYHTHSGDTLTFNLSVPILPNGIRDGFYTMRIFAQDNAGNSLSPLNPWVGYFIYDSRAPRVDSTVPRNGAVDYLLRDSVWASISDEYPGIDSVSGVNTATSTIELFYPDGSGVPGYGGVFRSRAVFYIYQGTNLPPGDYMMVLHLEDRAGNITDDTVRFNVGERLVITDIEPDSGAFVNRLDTVRVTICDRLGVGVDTLSSVRVYDQGGNMLPGHFEYMGPDTELTFIYVLDSTVTRSGRYFINVTPLSVDGVVGQSRTYDFMLDAVPPQLITSSVEDGDTLIRSPQELFVTVGDISGIDTTNTFLRLFDPSWRPVGGHVEFRFGGKDGFNKLLGIDDGKLGDTIVFVLDSTLKVEGTYYFYSYITDIAGNTKIDTISFDYLLPIEVRTNPRSGEVVTTQLTAVYAYVKDRTGLGLQSVSVWLSHANLNDTIPGTQSMLNDTTFAWTLDQPLAVDGSDNGGYRVNVVASNGGGDVVTGTALFTYIVDQVPPPRPIISPDVPTDVWYDTLTVIGKTEPYALVTVVINDSTTRITQAGPDSIFVFDTLRLVFDTTNVLKFVAADAFGNISDTTELEVKAAPPSFSVAPSMPFTDADHVFRFSLPQSAHVTVTIYNLRGDKLATLEADLPMGKYLTLNWDMKNNDGQDVNNGPLLYVAEVEYADGTKDRKKDIIIVAR